MDENMYSMRLIILVVERGIKTRKVAEYA